ncbi:LuxR C-terminal-related transcriptional regulator [Dactylosporangium sp. NPDC048998]|uniref:LuxR C-terminal-related transcriptional regulator n=1 Tax=Dactylosporangium sp. NPDC048998 TaxID=3363976 RepID=UPI003717ADCE
MDPSAATALYLSPNAVKTHVASIYRKMAVHTRRDAIRAAFALGIFPTRWRSTGPHVGRHRTRLLTSVREPSSLRRLRRC